MMLICTLLTLVMGCASPRKYKENRSADQFQQADSVSNQDTDGDGCNIMV